MGSVSHKIYGGLKLIQVCRDWPKWFREYFDHANDLHDDRYAMRNGAVLHTRRNQSDLHMIDEIWAFRKYDYFGFQVAPDDVVVDIGANIGTFAVYAATECRAGRVISFEPHPENFAMLRKNVESNRLTSVTCVNEAVAGVPGKALLQVSEGNAGAHSLGGQRTDGSVEVDCCTLQEVVDRFGLDSIDYLKLDCEGSEYGILETAPEDLMRRIRRISMEYHHIEGRRTEELGQILEKHAFTVRYFGGHRIYAQRAD